MIPLDETSDRGEPALEIGHRWPDQSASDPKSWDDLRHYPRFSFRARLEATIHPLPGDNQPHSLKCWLLARDLSRGGINLLHSQPLARGQRIDIALRGDDPRTVEVVWCRRLAHRCYSLGCHFVKDQATPPETPESAAPRPTG